MTRARGMSALLVVGALSLAACGGGDDRGAAPAATTAPAVSAPVGDAAKITELARSVVLADKVGDMCRERFSAQFVSTVFGSVAKCEKAWHPDDPKNRTTGATVSDVDVTGQAATAIVTEQGGEWDGARGTWAFLRAGDTWRVAAWGVDYLRSAMRASFSPAQRSTEPGNLLGDLGVLSCLSDRLQRLDDTAFTTLTYRLFRGNAEAAATVDAATLACAKVPGTDGLSPLRRSFEVGVRQGAERGGMARIGDCLTRRLRTAISDEELVGATGTFLATGNYPKQLQRRVNGVSIDCALAKV